MYLPHFSHHTLCHYYVPLSPPPELSVTNPRSPTIILPFLLRLSRHTETLILFLFHPSKPTFSSPLPLSLSLLSLSLSFSSPLEELPDLGHVRLSQGNRSSDLQTCKWIPTSDVNPQRHARPGIPPSSLQAFPTVVGQKALSVMPRLHFLWLAQTGK